MTRPIKSVAYCLFMVPSYEFSKRLKTSLTSLSKDFLQMPIHAVDPWILSSCNRRYSEHRQRRCPYKCGKTTRLQGIARHWAKSKMDKPPSPGANPRLPRNTLLDENKQTRKQTQNFPQPRVTTGKWGGGGGGWGTWSRSPSGLPGPVTVCHETSEHRTSVSVEKYRFLHSRHGALSLTHHLSPSPSLRCYFSPTEPRYGAATCGRALSGRDLWQASVPRRGKRGPAGSRLMGWRWSH